MSCYNSSSGDPEESRRNLKIIKFNRLSDVKQTDSKGTIMEKASGYKKTKQKVMARNSPRQEALFQQPVKHPISCHTCTVGATSCSTPARIFRKDSGSNLDESSFFAETLKNFDQKNNGGVVKIPGKIESNISSTYISAPENSDENLHEVYDSSDSKSRESVCNVLFEDSNLKIKKKIRNKVSTSEISNDSRLESGYKSYNTNTTIHKTTADGSNAVGEDNSQLATHPTNTPTVKGCKSDVNPIYRPSKPSPATTLHSLADSMSASSGTYTADSTDQISKFILELIRPNSRIGKIILQSTGDQNTDNIYEEIKRCVRAELQMENQLNTFFKKDETPKVAAEKYNSLRHLDNSLAFVKEHLVQIHSDFNDFKENCWQKIESKVSHAEFSDTTAILRAKMTHLERKLFNEHRLMRQDLRGFREKVTHLENEANCGFSSCPLWPFIAFIGAYSLVSLGKR